MTFTPTYPFNILIEMLLQFTNNFNFDVESIIDKLY